MPGALKVIGITGGIGMGKSTLAAQMAELGVPVCSADAATHQLLTKDPAAIAAVGSAFPGVGGAAGIDRKKLGDMVFYDRKKMETLEAILHPLVVREEQAFIRRQQALGKSLVALEIPLLYETGAEQRCDAVIVASAPEDVQKARVLARPDMTEEKFVRIRSLQMDDAEKRKRADYVIDTGSGEEESLKQLKAIMEGLRA